MSDEDNQIQKPPILIEWDDVKGKVYNVALCAAGLGFMAAAVLLTFPKDIKTSSANDWIASGLELLITRSFYRSMKRSEQEIVISINNSYEANKPQYDSVKINLDFAQPAMQERAKSMINQNNKITKVLSLMAGYWTLKTADNCKNMLAETSYDYIMSPAVTAPIVIAATVGTVMCLRNLKTKINRLGQPHGVE